LVILFANKFSYLDVNLTPPRRTMKEAGGASFRVETGARGTIGAGPGYSGSMIAMSLIVIGALLIVSGISLAAWRTASRGSLSDPHATGPGAQMETLEPRGRGGRLSFKADLPGIGLVVAGAILLLSAFL
jgi:hypothetical protein